ncbi:MAG: orotate phosphoribosyltransferase [Bacteroidales bacterium]|jgi:orotate phosphoribosyltransferase|nr:orotate phosphoribosyltransferase [Bacteroidales bacterium]
MNVTSKIISEKLLQIKAIKLEPANFFTWASGWHSPIYCDNRKTLSFPEIRTFIKDSFVSLIQEKFSNYDIIAGVATGAIAQGALVADKLSKPFVYVRSSSKDHGLGNQIEGSICIGQKVVIVEDLISTGGSSLNAVKALREAGCEIVGMVAIFSYQFQKSQDAFEVEKIPLYTLSNYNDLIDTALNLNYISEKEVDLLKEWRLDPENWKK